MKKTWFLLMVLLMVLLSCHLVSSASNPTTITVMYNNTEFPAELAKAFETANPDLKIVRIETDTARYMAMNAAGNPPDVMRCNSAWIPYLATHKMALNIGPYIKKAKYLKQQDLLPINDSFKYKGKYYGVAKDWSPTTIGYYNKDAFKEAGIPFPSVTRAMTYKQLAEIARKLQKTEGDRVVRRGLSFWPGEPYHQIIAGVLSQSQKLYSKDGAKIILTKNPKVKEIVKFFYDLAKEKLISSPISTAESWEGQMFQNGRVAMIVYGYWYGAMCEGELNKGKVGVMASPVWDLKQTRVSPSFNVVGGFISGKTKHPAAAFRFYDWFFAGPPAKERAASGWGVPAQKSLLDLVATDTPLGKERQLNLKSEMEYVKVDTPSPYILPEVFNNSVSKNFELALRGDITLDRFLANVEAEVNKAIKDSRASFK
jgi:multiple sugar transport system substrate-binding protein